MFPERGFSGMRFGLFHTVQLLPGVDPATSFREALDEAVYAEELGFSSIWLTEHHFNRHGIISDSLNVLSHLAARTSRVRLGTAVAVLPFHNPVRLAESSALVDVLSGGRLDFGVGRGYQWSEFNGFGVDLADRAKRFDEALSVIRRAWTSEEPFEHAGDYWKFGSVTVQPRPTQRPHPPVWIATDSEDGLRRCAREGFGVLFPQGSSLAVVEEQVARYRNALDAEGVPFDPAKLALARAMYVDETDEIARAVAEPNYLAFLEGARAAAAPPGGGEGRAANPFETPDFREVSIFGSPDSCVEHLHRIRDLGIEHVLLFVRFQQVGHERTRRSLALFANEVMPRLQQPRPAPVP